MSEKALSVDQIKSIIESETSGLVWDTYHLAKAIHDALPEPVSDTSAAISERIKELEERNKFLELREKQRCFPDVFGNSCDVETIRTLTAQLAEMTRQRDNMVEGFKSIVDMPEYDQDDQYRLRHIARNFIGGQP
jgi:hypothetical protein